jgi:hypothetical protein
MLVHLSDSDVSWLIDFLQSQKGRVREKIDELYLEKLRTHFEIEEAKWTGVLQDHEEISPREKELIHGVMNYVASSTKSPNATSEAKQELVKVTWKLIRTMYTTVINEEGEKALDWCFHNYRGECAITASHLYERAGAGKPLEEGGDSQEVTEEMAKTLSNQIDEIIRLSGFSVASIAMGLWIAMARAYNNAQMLVEKSTKFLEDHNLSIKAHEDWMINSLEAGHMMVLNLLHLEMLDLDGRKLTSEDLMDAIVKVKEGTFVQ